MPSSEPNSAGTTCITRGFSADFCCTFLIVLIAGLQHFQLKAQIPSRKYPSPAQLVPHRITVRDSPDDLVQQRRPKNYLPATHAEARPRVKGTFVFFPKTVEGRIAEE